MRPSCPPCARAIPSPPPRESTGATPASGGSAVLGPATTRAGRGAGNPWNYGFRAGGRDVTVTRVTSVPPPPPLDLPAPRQPPGWPAPSPPPRQGGSAGKVVLAVVAVAVAGVGLVVWLDRDGGREDAGGASPAEAART